MDGHTSASDDQAPRRRLHTGQIVLGSIGLAALAIGLTLALTATGDSASFGWFAYQPLSGTVFTPPHALLTLQGQIGLALGVGGLATLAFSAGWAFGTRHGELGHHG